jgi:cAMP-binding proteins - catabolite gene activator and regulatory subunit of cAMP-dependent protein kinases
VTDSCLVERLGHYLTLTEREQHAFAQLEGPERIFRRGALIRREHDRAQELFVVNSGWLLSFVLLDDGSRQILRLHLPGDMVGLSCAAFNEATESLVALTDVRLSPVEKSSLSRLFVEHPRLGALLFLIAQAEKVSLSDRLASLGRTSAKARVAALILDTVARLRVMDAKLGDSFAFPLTQEEIGDATGLTAVHVNRMIRALVEDGLIARQANQLTIRNEQRLAEVANYINRYAALDTDWLPSPT